MPVIYAARDARQESGANYFTGEYDFREGREFVSRETRAGLNPRLEEIRLGANRTKA